MTDDGDPENKKPNEAGRDSFGPFQRTPDPVASPHMIRRNTQNAPSAVWESYGHEQKRRKENEERQSDYINQTVDPTVATISQ